MKFLTCLFCDSELELLNPFDTSFHKKIKCSGCNFTSQNWKQEKKYTGPEVVIIKQRKTEL